MVSPKRARAPADTRPHDVSGNGWSTRVHTRDGSLSVRFGLTLKFHHRKHATQNMVLRTFSPSVPRA